MMVVLKIGDVGLAVSALQRQLGTHGFPVKIDGNFGPSTQIALLAFQRSAGLVADGVAGPLTLVALGGPVIATPAGDTVVVKGLELPAVRCVPLRALADGRRPIVTSRHSSHNGSRPTHHGIDLLYSYLPSDPPMKIGDSGRTKGYWIPPETWSVAPAAGRVVVAGNSPTGFRVWIRHAGGLLTGGFHYDQIAVLLGQEVAMGDRVGRVNDNPKDTDPDHLHWEMYQGTANNEGTAIIGYPSGTLDPELWLDGAQLLPAV